jgi:hypothetical protein
LAIIGYASSIEAAREFETNLRNSGAFVDVYLEEQYFDPVPDSNLADARVVSPVSGKMATTKTKDGNAGEKRGFAALGQATPILPNAAATTNVATGVELFVFHIDVQFVGKPNPHPPSRTASTKTNPE